MEQLALPIEISEVVKNIVERFTPLKIYLFSKKDGAGGDTSSFKLCVIMDCADRDDVGREIYRHIDSDIPYDVVIYTPGEWDELTERKGSFAQKVSMTGVLVHE